MSRTFRVTSLVAFGILGLISAFLLPGLRFSFDFEQFFPRGDSDLAFFREFIQEFESDDSFLLIALEREEGIFDSAFLAQAHDLSLKVRQLPHVVESFSLTQVAYPLRTPFGITTIPAIHLDDPGRYESDRKKILSDERLVHALVDPEGKALAIYLKTIPNISLSQSEEFIQATEDLIRPYGFEDYHFLGRAFFQKEIVAMQKREITVSALVASLLVSLAMGLIFRRIWGIVVAMASVGLGMLIFLGFLAATGRELSAMAALYPVLMLIVGTSDVIHIMSKYLDELERGNPRHTAIRITVKEIGLATLLTSVTTAVGFLSLLSSRIQPIRDFGLNAAVGVLIAYVTVLFFTTSILSLFHADQIVKIGPVNNFWNRNMDRLYRFTKDKARQIAWFSLGFVALLLVGISQITTNYTLIKNFPSGKKITEDFKFFEERFTGFRPMEVAVTAKPPYKANDFEALREMSKLEDHMRQYEAIRGAMSISAVYKAMRQAFNGNRPEEFRFPETEEEFRRYQRYAKDAPKFGANVLLSKDEQKARITARLLDVGADSIKAMNASIGQWVTENIDPEKISVRITGTGLIIDKNAEYVRRSLIMGLGLAVLVVAIMMGFLFRSWRMLAVAIVPNLIPLLVAGALLGFLGIELEAGVSIVFSVIFGIAVDDTIHFLAKYRLALAAGKPMEEAIRITFMETGKAIVLTTLLLFAGFLVMLFSIHPPSVTIGLLISGTLVSALVFDLLLIPILLRWMAIGK
jgi:uncharacterized protein